MLKHSNRSTTGSFDSVKGRIHYSNVLILAIPDQVLKGHVYLYILVCPDVNIVLEFDCIFLNLICLNRTERKFGFVSITQNGRRDVHSFHTNALRHISFHLVVDQRKKKIHQKYESIAL